jgi:hypothetical protein
MHAGREIGAMVWGGAIIKGWRRTVETPRGEMVRSEAGALKRRLGNIVMGRKVGEGRVLARGRALIKIRVDASINSFCQARKGTVN